MTNGRHRNVCHYFRKHRTEIVVLPLCFIAFLLYPAPEDVYSCAEYYRSEDTAFDTEFAAGKYSYIMFCGRAEYRRYSVSSADAYSPEISLGEVPYRVYRTYPPYVIKSDDVHGGENAEQRKVEA